jgi:CheY-like chemotaxis protein
MKILVIEDSRMIRLAMEKSLSKAGYEVTCIGDGQLGLNLAQTMHPDLILLDMMLPTLEGTGVLRQLRKDPSTKLIPVVVLSGLSQKNEQKLKSAGATAYFEKSKLDLDNNNGALVHLVEELFSCTSQTNPAR